MRWPGGTHLEMRDDMFEQCVSGQESDAGVDRLRADNVDVRDGPRAGGTARTVRLAFEVTGATSIGATGRIAVRTSNTRCGTMRRLLTYLSLAETGEVSRTPAKSLEPELHGPAES